MDNLIVQNQKNNQKNILINIVNKFSIIER